MTDEVVIRLYRALVEELHRRGHPEDRPLEVSELYRDVIPYRAVRSALGVALNADYEDALLRLLAGERDLLRLEPEEARAELQREVEAPYPSVGLFRKFSASKVWVNMPDETRPLALETADGTGPDAEGETAEAAEESEAAKGAAPREPGGSAEDGAARAPSGGWSRADSESAQLEGLARSCPGCQKLLPVGLGVRYCPHCGREQHLRPCPRCDAALAPEWRFCVGCGYEAGTG